MDTTVPKLAPRGVKHAAALLAGPLLAIIILFLDLKPGSPAVTYMAAAAVWMAAPLAAAIDDGTDEGGRCT